MPPHAQMSMIAMLGLIQFGSVVQYGPWMPIEAEAAVDDADGAVEEEEEHDADRDRRRDVRQVEDRAEGAGELLRRRASGASRAASATMIFPGTIITRVDEGVLQRRRDLRVVEQLAGSCRGRRSSSARGRRSAASAVVRERVVEAEEHRPQREDEEAEEPRQDEQVGDPGLALAEAGEPAPGPRGARRCVACCGDARQAPWTVLATCSRRSPPALPSGPGSAPRFGVCWPARTRLIASV